MHQVPGVTITTMEGVDTVLVEHGGVKEIYATALPGAGDDLASLARRLHRVLQESGSQILEMKVFGDLERLAGGPGLLQELFRPIDWPLVFIEGADCFGHEVAGIQVRGVLGVPVRSLPGEDRVRGRVFEDQYARYCVLGDLRSADPTGPGTDQTRDTLVQLVGGLNAAGMDIHNLVRTWFYLSDILGWYRAFNGVRSEIYSSEGVFDRFVPASTGIGGESGSGAAVVASALAVQPKTEAVTIRPVPSPLQCPALDYGSSFSRAAELAMPDCRFVIVSGTASIDETGATVHPGDVGAQIEHTLEVVGAILDSRNMGFGDVIRGNAYFKHREDAGKLAEPAARYGLPTSRVVVSQNAVCREDLLFELEVDAAREGGFGEAS